MAMCMAAATVVTSPWGGGMTAYAAEETKTITVSAYDYTAVDAGIEGASKTGVIMGTDSRGGCGHNYNAGCTEGI